MRFHPSALEPFSLQMLTFPRWPEMGREIYSPPAARHHRNGHERSWARWRNVLLLAAALLSPPRLPQHPFVLLHQSVTKPFREDCFTDAGGSATLSPHSPWVLSVLLIVDAAGTPPGPAGMGDGQVCNRRHWLGGAGLQAGGAAGSGRSWQEPSLPLLVSGQHSPSPVLRRQRQDLVTIYI